MIFNAWGKTYAIGRTRGVVIVDLDGTLANGAHRLHLLPTKDLHLTESWEEFNRASVSDSPIWDNIDVSNALYDAGMTIIILTGRSDSTKDITHNWLRDHGVKFHHLIMRRFEDNRKDTVLKEEVLRSIGLNNIVCAYDDSPEVIRHFRSLGITTYQVTEYDKPRSDIQSHGVEVLK